MELRDFEALSFDCYGTLIDWEAGIVAVLGPWAAAAGTAVTDEQLLADYAMHEAAAEAEMPAAVYPEILAESMRRLGAQLGIAVSADDAARLGSSVPDWPAFRDSAAALAVLATRFKLVILSNIDRTSFAGSNARLGVTFDAILTAQDIGSYKPSARNFDALLARTATMGISDGKLLHVAQSLFHDHVPAKAVGLPTVWINRRAERDGWGATPPPPADVTPDWTFASMAELAAAVG